MRGEPKNISPAVYSNVLPFCNQKSDYAGMRWRALCMVDAVFLQGWRGSGTTTYGSSLLALSTELAVEEDAALKMVSLTPYVKSNRTIRMA